MTKYSTYVLYNIHINIYSSFSTASHTLRTHHSHPPTHALTPTSRHVGVEGLRSAVDESKLTMGDAEGLRVAHRG